MSGTVIVTGGGGYIGHQVCLELQEQQLQEMMYVLKIGIVQFGQDGHLKKQDQEHVQIRMDVVQEM